MSLNLWPAVALVFALAYFSSSTARTELGGFGSVLFWSVIFVLLFKIWTRNPPRMKDWEASGTIEIARPPADVFEFIRRADTLALVHSAIERSFPIPGTPRGVGEQQGFIQELPDGSFSFGVAEIVEYTPPVRLALRNVSGDRAQIAFDLKPSTSGTQLTMTQSTAFKRWAVHDPSPSVTIRGTIDDYITGVKALMESGPEAS